ncbi:hypothetical protein [Dyadobacter bucti]|uniref:hypothetical protein n=1 Tax=Dyadobacter bucti TaxID=2572203 RepID=UPI003F6F5E34
MVPRHRKLKTGDILITQTAFPFIEHFGVVVVEGSTTCVYHCTPDKGVTLDTLVDFLTARNLIDIRPTNATASRIYEKYKELKAKKYNAISFNCIHFAECLTG